MSYQRATHCVAVQIVNEIPVANAVRWLLEKGHSG
jgi:hypothetical protein